jgi:transcription termination factor NusB
MDHIGPLVADEKGHQYVLVLIDSFSRWVELYPTKGVTADETAKCIFQHLGRFGAPERILTDRGTAFHNELVSELIHLSNSKHVLTTAHSKEENAIVERANQEVIRHLRALLFDKRVYNKWSFEELPLVQRIMNTVEKTATGVTPAELILNNSVRLTKRIFTEPSTMDRSKLKSMSGQLDTWISRQAILVKVAQEHQKATDLYRVSTYDNNYTDYPINSYVLYTHPNGKEHKLRPEHSGPYQVVNKIGDIYSILDLVSGKVIDTHVHQLRPFNYDPERTRPVDIARQTAQEFLIRDILAHRGDRNRRSTMEFLVKWEDFGDTESWEPYAGLRHVEKLHEYLRVHKMRSLIPVEHK